MGWIQLPTSPAEGSYQVQRLERQRRSARVSGQKEMLEGVGMLPFKTWKKKNHRGYFAVQSLRV